jgi:hypothetical protein
MYVFYIYKYSILMGVCYAGLRGLCAGCAGCSVAVERVEEEAEAEAVDEEERRSWRRFEGGAWMVEVLR